MGALGNPWGYPWVPWRALIDLSGSFWVALEAFGSPRRPCRRSLAQVKQKAPHTGLQVVKKLNDLLALMFSEGVLNYLRIVTFDPPPGTLRHDLYITIGAKIAGLRALILRQLLTQLIAD